MREVWGGGRYPPRRALTRRESLCKEPVSIYFSLQVRLPPPFPAHRQSLKFTPKVQTSSTHVSPSFVVKKLNIQKLVKALINIKGAIEDVKKFYIAVVLFFPKLSAFCDFTKHVIIRWFKNVFIIQIITRIKNSLKHRNAQFRYIGASDSDQNP